PYALAKAAQSALTRAWAAEAGNRLTIAEIVPPPMPTALRGRFYPGENRDLLCPVQEAARRLMDRLRDGQITGAGRIEL
ncbi:MAG TPA: hypothetical protein VMM59_11880, partial [Thermohalobaculum sp.]|nr:hypothetical protein [Thermohalobaculum sp.]